MPSDDECADLDELIAEITIDAYGDEGYWSFLQAFEDQLPIPFNATLVGIDITVTTVDFDGNERRGLTADVTRDGQSSIVSILDLELPDSQAEVKRLVSAYRRWLGIT